MGSHDRAHAPVVIAECQSEVHAAILRAALAAEEIPAWIEGALTAGFRAEAPGRCRLLVRADDAAKARAVLEPDGDREQPDGDE